MVRVAVAAATEALRLLGVGSRPTAAAAAAAVPPGDPVRPAPGDTAAVLKALKADYLLRSYFISGVLSDGIYDEDCLFADPTVSFRGRELWKRNLALLTPFLENPSVQLIGEPVQIAPADNDAQRGPLLQADWVLRCGLKLPWRPYVCVRGSTEYELAWPEGNRVVRHTEAWDIDGWEAVAMVLRPGKDSGRQ